MNTTETVIYASGIFKQEISILLKAFFLALMILRHNSWKISQAHVINDALRKTLIWLIFRIIVVENYIRFCDNLFFKCF